MISETSTRYGSGDGRRHGKSRLARSNQASKRLLRVTVAILYGLPLWRVARLNGR
jgi:hypothetical protein